MNIKSFFFFAALIFTFFYSGPLWAQSSTEPISKSAMGSEASTNPISSSSRAHSTKQSLRDYLKMGRQNLTQDRYFSLGFLLGGSSLTGNDGYAAPSVGTSFSYRISKHFGAQMVYAFSRYNTEGSINPSVNQSYFSVQGLAFLFNNNHKSSIWKRLNPFAVLGASQNYSTQSQNRTAPLSHRGLDFGAGLQLPLSRQRAYVGFQALYKWVPGTISQTQSAPLSHTNQWNFHLNFGINL